MSELGWIVGIIMGYILGAIFGWTIKGLWDTEKEAKKK